MYVRISRVGYVMRLLSKLTKNLNGKKLSERRWWFEKSVATFKIVGRHCNLGVILNGICVIFPKFNQ
jgi:hypothetical protein